jgi:hypothetical protein
MTFPNFSFEKMFWQKGFKFVVGVDEVGRGAWGPTRPGLANLENLGQPLIFN